MNYLKNHCWCSSSHWDEKHYDCQIIVTIEREDGFDDRDDWNNVMIKKSYYDEDVAEEVFEMHRKFFEKERPMTDDEIADYKKDVGTRFISVLKPEIMEWLEENVPDVNGEKGWCVGSNKYVNGDCCTSYSVFFQQTRPAMKFIKEFSKWKKPIYYTQYFSDVRKILNRETLKYEVR